MLIHSVYQRTLIVVKCWLVNQDFEHKPSELFQGGIGDMTRVEANKMWQRYLNSSTNEYHKCKAIAHSKEAWMKIGMNSAINKTAAVRKHFIYKYKHLYKWVVSSCVKGNNFSDSFSDSDKG